MTRKYSKIFMIQSANIYSQPKSQEHLIHKFSQSSADRLIVVVPDHLINLSHLWLVDLINHFEVMQRQKG